MYKNLLIILCFLIFAISACTSCNKCVECSVLDINTPVCKKDYNSKDDYENAILELENVGASCE